MSRYAEYCRRNNFYVDHMIQKWLLVALVVLEMLSIAIAVWALYHALDSVVEANLYRIHFHEDSSDLPAFIAIGIKIIIGIGIVNFAAIIAADRIWALYVNRILRNLDSIVRAALAFDFSVLQIARQEHAILDQAAGWHDDERMRLLRIRESVSDVPSQLPVSQGDLENTTRALHALEDCCRQGG